MLDKLTDANRRTALVALIETREGVDNADAIAVVLANADLVNNNFGERLSKQMYLASSKA